MGFLRRPLPGFAQVLRACLQRDPKQRVQAIGDVRLAMEGAFEAPVSAAAATVTAPQLRVWQRPMPAAMVALVIAAILSLGVWAVTRQPASPPDRVARFPMPLALTFSGTGRPIVAIAPTGDRVAFTAAGGLWLRPLDQMEATLVTGSEGARSPFFSADGQLRRVSVSGGARSRWVRQRTRGEPVGEPTTRSSSVTTRPHFPMLRENNVRVGFFEHDQYLGVIQHLPAELRPVVTFAYLTGWRIQSEILPIQWR